LIVSLACTAWLGLLVNARLSAEGAAVAAAGDPHLISFQSPRLQEFFPGDDAEFTITIINTGSIPFENVTVTGATSPDCNRNSLGPLAPDQTISYECERENVSQSFLNVIQVNGTAEGFPVTTHQSDAFVRVYTQELRIRKDPESQLVVFGGTAEFEYRVSNFSASLLNVTSIDDNLVPDCDFNPSSPLLLLPGESRNFTCEMPDVQEPMTTIITVNAENPLTNGQFVDSVAAWVDVLKLEAALTPSTTSLEEPGGVVAYMVDLVNSGSVRLTMTELTTDQFGDLLDPANPLVPAETNTCLSAPPSLAPYGGAYRCTFAAEVNSQPPSFTLTLTASGQEAGGLSVTTTAESTITIENIAASMSLSLGAEPPFISPPGRLVLYNVQVTNTSLVDVITITQMEDEYLGDLNGEGNCELPVANLLPGDAYSCQFADQVSGEDGDQHSREITVRAVSDDTLPENLIESDVITVGIIEQPGRELYFPIAADDTVEPNNHCLLAYPLILGRQYYFLPPQKYNGNLPLDQRDRDYFSFNVPEDARVEISLTNFLPQFVPPPPQTFKGQLIVSGHSPDQNPPCAPPISQHIITQANHQFQVADNGVLPAGRYYIQLINDGPSNVMTHYGIRVQVEIP